MPKMVIIERDPASKAAPKDLPAKKVSWQTALENIRLSGGAYRIKPEAGPAAPEARPLEEMAGSDLLAMAVGIGMKTEKQMKRAEIIRYIRSRLDAVEILDGEDEKG